MRIRGLIGGAVLVAAIFSSGSAFGHQTVGTDPTDTAVKCGANVTTIPSDPALYIDVRDVGGFAPPPVGHDGGYTWSIWIYAENNGHPGLQTKSGDIGGVVGDLEVEGTSSIENCTTAGHADMARDEIIF